MAQLRQDYQELVYRDAEVVVVGPEDRQSFAQYWDKEDLPFVGLPDPNHFVSTLYGQKVNIFKLGRLPSMIVIDKAGEIRYQHHGDSMRDIPSNEDILQLLDELNYGL